jgi:hypothetical protein
LVSFSPAQRDRASRAQFWFGICVVIVFCSEAVGCLIVGALPQYPLAWVALVGVALIVGGIGTALLNRLLLRPLAQAAIEREDLGTRALAGEACQAQLSSLAEQHRRVRHDIRGALSPALLTADRLLGHADPAVKRAADIMVRAVERTSNLLAGPEEASPPGEPREP